MSAVSRLLDACSPPLGGKSADFAEAASTSEWPAPELQALLERRDGFYGFESALHVFPYHPSPEEHGVVAWNHPDLWRGEYQGLTDGVLFFAEDVFGVQFCVRESRVETFDPETGAFEAMASGIEAWAQRILDDPRGWTGYPLAHAWQVAHGPLRAGQRLVPLRPFVLGGAFSVENLRAVEAVAGMRARAAVAVQIRDLPDGARIELKVVD